jgi:hypothetical protein
VRSVDESRVRGVRPKLLASDVSCDELLMERFIWRGLDGGRRIARCQEAEKAMAGCLEIR